MGKCIDQGEKNEDSNHECIKSGLDLAESWSCVGVSIGICTMSTSTSSGHSGVFEYG